MTYYFCVHVKKTPSITKVLALPDCEDRWQALDRINAVYGEDFFVTDQVFAEDEIETLPSSMVESR